MRITVISHFSDPRRSPLLTPEDFPAGVSGRMEAYDGGPLLPPPGEAVLLLTDDPALAAQGLEDKTGRLSVVFAGSQVPDRARLEDWWSPLEDREVLSWRLRKLLNHLKARYDAKLYRDALTVTMETVPDLIWFKNKSGVRLMVNQVFARRTGKPIQEIIGRDDFYIWDIDDDGTAPSCYESDMSAISAGKTWVGDEPITTPEGKKLFTVYKTPIVEPFGEVVGTVGVAHDVSGFQNLDHELSMLVEHMPFAVTIFTPDWKVVRMNHPFLFTAGITDLQSFDYRKWVSSLIPVGPQREVALHHARINEYVTEASGDNCRNLTIAEVEIRDDFDNLAGYFVTVEDNTLQKGFERRILHAAHTDELTELRNRRFFYSKLAEKAGVPFFLLYMDMDHFKEINDIHGHLLGDDVLVKTADLIREIFPGMLAARLGGDEFAVAVEGCSEAEVLALCRRMEEAVEEAFREYGCGTTISIGLAYCDGTVDIDRLIRESDERMYEEKEQHHAGEQGEAPRK